MQGGQRNWIQQAAPYMDRRDPYVPYRRGKQEGSLGESSKGIIDELLRSRAEDRQQIDALTTRLKYVELELGKRKQTNQHSTPPLTDRRNDYANNIAHSEVRRRVDGLQGTVQALKKQHEDALLALGKEVRIQQSRLAALAANGKSIQTAITQDSRASYAEGANLKAQLESLATQLSKLRDHIAFQDNRIEQHKQQFSQACEALGRGVHMKEAEYREQVNVALEKLKMEKQYDNRLMEQQCLRAETNSKQVQEAFDSRAIIAELKIKEERSNRLQQQQILKESLTTKLDVLDTKVKELVRDLEKNREEVDCKVSTISINMTGWKKQTKIDLSRLIKQVVLKIERASQRNTNHLDAAVETWNKSLSKVQEVLKAEVKVRQSALEKIQQGFQADTGHMKETLRDFESKINDTRRTLQSSVESADKALQDRIADVRVLLSELRSDASSNLLEAKKKLQAAVSDNSRMLEHCDKKVVTLERKSDDTDERLRVSIDNCMASQFEGQAQLQRTLTEKLENEVDKLTASIAKQAKTEASDRERACEAVAASAQKQLHSRIIATEDKLMECQDRLQASHDKFVEMTTTELQEIREEVEENKQESTTGIEYLTSEMEGRFASLQENVSGNKAYSDKRIEELSSGLDATDKEVMESKKCLRIEAAELKAEIAEALTTERETREDSLNSVNERMDTIHGGQEQLRDLLGDLRVHVETKIATSVADTEARADEKLRGFQEEVNTNFEGLRDTFRGELEVEQSESKAAHEALERQLEEGLEGVTKSLGTLTLHVDDIEVQRASSEALQKTVHDAEISEYRQNQDRFEERLKLLAGRLDGSEQKAASQVLSVQDMCIKANSSTTIELAVGLTLASLISAVCEKSNTDSIVEIQQRCDQASRSSKALQIQLVDTLDSATSRADTHATEANKLKERLDAAEKLVETTRRESADESKLHNDELQIHAAKLESLSQNKADKEDVQGLKENCEASKDLIHQTAVRLDKVEDRFKRQVQESVSSNPSHNDPKASAEPEQSSSTSEEPTSSNDTDGTKEAANTERAERSNLDYDGSLQSQLLEVSKPEN